MARKKDSYCVNHPARLATARCKQCHKPLCGECARDYGDDGSFCSDKCHTVYSRFAHRAKELPYKRSRSPLSRIVGFVTGLLKAAIVAVVLLVALMISGNQLGVGLKYNGAKKPIPFDLVLPK